jgi:hypothetical protein
MADLVVITPSRDRPQQFGEMIRAVDQTTDGRVEVLGLVDDDDPQLDAYDALGAWLMIGQRRSLSAWTNEGARYVLGGGLGERLPRYLASLGDDHRPRRGWDLKLIEAIEALDGPGFAYGNDLYQGQRLPTAWVVSSEVVKAVGWMMLPACQHMYVDQAVLHLGLSSNRITYRPDVIVEHLHPYAGKADMDASYRESNTPARFDADRLAFEAWYRDEMPADVAKVQALTWTEVSCHSSGS